MNGEWLNTGVLNTLNILLLIIITIIMKISNWNVECFKYGKFTVVIFFIIGRYKLLEMFEEDTPHSEHELILYVLKM